MVGWWRSSIGKKVLMAVSGLMLVGFVIAHLMGNLLIFQGPAALNAYGGKLRDLGVLLWFARAGLLAALVIHVWTSIELSLENRRARPCGYRMHRMRRTTLAARFMLVSGIAVVGYVAYHLLHFTFGVIHPEWSHSLDPFGHHDIYAMVVHSFRQWPIALIYVVGVGAVCVHISHGIGSVVQTLGVNSERTIDLATRVGQWLAVAIFLGYSAIPIAVLWGVVR